MPISRGKKKVKKENFFYKQNPTTERNITKENEIPLEEIPHSLPFYKIKWKLALIIISGIILISGLIFTVVYFLKPKKKHPIESPGFPGNINMTKAKEVFSPMFKLKTEEKTLTQLSQKSLQIYNSSIKGQNDSYMIFTKTIYDIYPINSTSWSEIDKNFYNNIYYTAITVNSLCSKLTKDPLNDDCELEKIFDLNQKNENTKNLRRNEEEIQDYIRQALLPICIIEHTDTNLILSSTCPETLSRNYINDIIRAFNNIKPVSYKGYDFDKDYVNTLLEEKGDKIYISSYDNVCLDPNDDQKKTIICNLTKIIITDKEGNFISNKISNSTLTQDENKLFYSNYTYEFKNNPKETSQSLMKKYIKKI